MRWLLLALLIVSSPAFADSWMPPSKRTYVSADKTVRLIVVPRPFNGALAYFEDKVAGREPAGAPAGSQTATASLQKRDKAGRWVTNWTKPLTNEVAPVSVLVTNDGRIATFDNWASMGYGDNVIVIYDQVGNVVRKFALTDLFPDWFVAAQSHSVSSIWWRGDPRIARDGTAVVVPVTLPSKDSMPFGAGPDLDLSIRLADGAPLGLADPAWKAALREAAVTARDKCQADRDYIAKWNSAEGAPTDWDEPAWHAYLREIYYRTAPMVDGDFPDAVGTTVLRPGSASDFAPSLGWLKEALTEKTNIPDLDVRAIGSPDFERLTQEIEKIAPTIKADQLKGVKLIIVLDAPRAERVRAALARSGASLRIVDPRETFPQRPERMQKTTAADLPVCQVPGVPAQ